MFETGKLNEIIRDFDLLSATHASGLNGELGGLITRLKLLAFETDPTQPYQSTGRSLSAYFDEPRDESQILLGNYFLERGCALCLFAQSGIGKSSLTMQAAACWACGKECIDLAPPSPLRIVVFQIEDTENDLRFQSKIIKPLKLDRKLLAQNCFIETLRGLQGQRAIDAMSAVLEARAPIDLIFINPLGPYLEGDIMKPADVTKFLYAQLQPMLDHFKCGAVLPHHTSKTQFQRRDSWSPYDYMYSGAGPATITNFARAIITIEPIKDSQFAIFIFRLAKRFRESGWLFDVARFRHSDDPECPIWLSCSAAEAKEARKKTGKDFTDLQELVPVLGSIPKATLAQAAQDAGFTKIRYQAVLAEALAPDTGPSFRLYSWMVLPESGGKKIEHIARSPEPSDLNVQAEEERAERLRQNSAERMKRKREKERAEEEKQGPVLFTEEPPPEA